MMILFLAAKFAVLLGTAAFLMRLNIQSDVERSLYCEYDLLIILINFPKLIYQLMYQISHLDFAHQYENPSENLSSRGNINETIFTIEENRKQAKLELRTRKQKQTNNDRKFNASLWQLRENEAYMSFLVNNQKQFYTSRTHRKNLKINVLMSEIVKTRSADQCRSHHQKMMKHHHTIPNIITYIQRLKATKQNHPNQLKLQIQSFLPVESKNCNFSLYSPLTDQNEGLFGEMEEWQPWLELMEEKKHIQSWFYGVEDKYGNI